MKSKISKHLRILYVSLTVAVAMGLYLPALGYVSPQQRASQQLDSNSEVLVAGLRFRLRNIKAPGNRTAGASRGGCSSYIQAPTALLPSTDPTQIGLTATANPTFYFHVPQATTKPVEFTLQKLNDEVVYETSVDLSNAPGIVSVSLPKESLNSPSLEVGKTYHWNLSIVCDPTDRGQDIILGGWIRRDEMTSALVRQLQSAAQKDRPSLYAEAGFWYDTVASLAQLREANPNDRQLADDWKTLLQSVGLDAIAQSPLVGSVTTIQN